MKSRLGAFTASAILFATSAGAVPPPPPSSGYTQSWRAIDNLASFQGHWTGKEVPNTPSGDLRPLRAYRLVQRLGGKDIILLEQGIQNVGDGKPFPLAYDIIVFDVKSRLYKAFLPGYREFTGEDQSSQLVTVEHPNATTLIWSAALADGGRRRTTVSVTPQSWHERVEQVSADGQTRVLADFDLTRAPSEATP